MDILSEKIENLSPKQRALLEKLMKQRGIIDSASRRNVIELQPRTDIHYPLSSAQQRLWFLHQFDNAGEVFNVHAAIKLRGSVDPALLKESFRMIVARHESLRTRFVKVDGKPFQTITSEALFGFEYFELNQIASVDACIDRHRKQKFDLERGPLIMVALLQIAASEQILLLTMHHIVSDGWSMQTLINEVFTHYSCLFSGESSTLEPLAIQYIDYACWQQKNLQSDALKKQLQFWQNTLADAPHYLELPTDYPRPKQFSYHGAGVRFTVPSAVLNLLKQCAKEQNCSIFMLGLTAYSVLLSTYCGKTDILIGTDIANRNNLQVKPLIGFFINQLVLRCRWQGDLTLHELAQNIRQHCLDTYANQDLPFNYLVEQLNVARDPSRTPLFQTKFVIDNSGGAVASKAGFELMEWDPEVVEFDIEVALKELDNTLEGYFRYKTGLFSAQRIHNMVEQYLMILRLIADQPHIRLSQIEFLTVTQRQLLNQINDTQTTFEQTVFIDTLLTFDATDANRTAVQYLDERCSYSRLKHDIEHLAAYLLQQGITPGQVIAVCLPRGIDVLCAYLAILRIGACYVPIDMDAGRVRIGYILKDSGAMYLLANSIFELDDHDTAIERLHVPKEWRALDSAIPVVWPTVHPEQLAYIIYTSGSTGKPKGVAVSRRALNNFLYSMQQICGMSKHDRLLAVTTVAFDISGLELYLPLLCKAQLYISTKEQAMDSRVLWSMLVDHDITYLQATPATWRGLCTIAKDRRLPNLTALCGGEALPKDLAEHLSHLCDSVFNLYGPTETTIWSSSVKLEQYLLTHISHAPLGKPISNTQFYILDRYNNRQAPGIPGELCIAGDGLAHGYWNKAALTAQAFVPDPFSGQPSARLYRTGDCVKLLEDGRFVYLGRYDHQVKVRGYRIEMGEIEHVLGSHPDIDQAVVVEKKDALHVSVLHAFVTLSKDAVTAEIDVLQKRLLAYARERLPLYMLPAHMQFLEKLPVSASGKLDRSALQRLAQETGHSEVNATGTVPVTALEIQVAAIWCEALGLEKAFIEQNFFEYGGHSLLAIHLLDKIVTVTQCRISLQDFFQQPTLQGVVNCLQNKRAEEVEAYSLIVPDPDHRYEPFPLTDLQQAYLIGRQADFELGSIATQNYIEIDIHHLDVEHFTHCWNTLLQRHEMLRAVFDSTGLQRILPHTQMYRPKLHDLSALDEEERSAALASMRNTLSSQTLSEKTGPLFAIEISKIDLHRYRIHICMDMLISDVLSNFILFGELDLLYREKTVVLPPLELSFRDYMLAEAALKQSSRYTRAREYWLERLPQFPSAPELPLAKNPKDLQQQRFIRRYYDIEAPLWSKLKKIAKSHDISPTVLLLTAFAQVLGTWSKTKRFVLNLTLFNRLPLHPQVQLIVGDFTSSLLLELAFNASHNFSERAASVQTRLWQDLDHKIFSGVSVIRELTRLNGGTQQISMPVVFTSMLGLGESNDEEIWHENGRGEEHYSVSQTSQVWLDHQVIERNGTLNLVWDAIDDLFPAGMLDDMFSAYQTLLLDLAEAHHWEETICLTPKYQLQLREQINGRSHPIKEVLLHHLFEQQVKRSPENIAIYNAGQAISYVQLDRWSNGLAALLHAQGARRNHLIAVVMHKSWEQLVAVLAILKAGAAYLPINAELPEARIQELLVQGECNILITRDRHIAGLTGLDRFNIIQIDDVFLDGLFDQMPVLQRDWLDIAYVIFTSGSTGKPKGVVIDHRGAVNTVLDINRRFEVDRTDSVLAMSSLSFDLSVYDIFGILAVGGRIVIPDYNQLDAAKHWWALLQEKEVTIWNTVPALMQLLVDYCESLPRPNLSSLRLVMMSGDWIPVDLPDRIRKLAPNCKVISLGGATEASIWSIFHPITGSTSHLRSIPYGKPLTNQSFYVLDEQLDACPDWVPGHLYIGGTGVAKGYWRDTERTAASFIETQRSGVLYKTGDLGRYTQDGIIEFLGREDSQVKIQGYRVELGEIEAVLQQHPAIETAVVTAWGETRSGKALAAYVVPRMQNEENAQALIKSAQERSLFKLEQKGCRRLDKALLRIALREISILNNITQPESHSRIAAPDTYLESLDLLCSGLRQVHISQAPLPKYFYPSASSLYPVQLYLDIIADHPRIPRGFYYYSAIENAFVRLSEEPIDNTLTTPRFYWIADMSAIAPLYPKDEVFRFIYLEAGYMQSILISQANHLNLPLTHVGNTDAEFIKSQYLPEQAYFLAYTDMQAPVMPQENIDQLLSPAFNASAMQIDLPEAASLQNLSYDILKRQSFRQFIPQALTLQQLAGLLHIFQCTEMPTMDILLFIKSGRCEGNLCGWYYYWPAKHSLQAISIDSDSNFPDRLYNIENRNILQEAGFALYLLDREGECSPHYRSNLLTCGRIGQHLMSYSWLINIGLCPIGQIEQTVLNQVLGFNTNTLMLHGFLGGLIKPEQLESWTVDQQPGQALENITDALTAFLQTRLPVYMVPKRYLLLDKIPLSANGKVDRKSLPMPDLQVQDSHTHQAPRNSFEERLAEIWQSELSVEQISMQDNFFALGGNSLIAMRIVSKLHIEHDIDIGLRAIFERPTITELACLIAERKKDIQTAFSDIYTICASPVKDPSADIYPLTYAQRHLFAHSQTQADQSAYNITTALQISGPLNVNALQDTLQQILDRHAALRTRFIYQDGEIYQKVDLQKSVFCQSLRLPDTSETEIQNEIREHLQAEAAYVFDMFAGPMFRSRLLSISAERHVIIINVHHIIADFLSMDLIAKELATIYSAKLSGEPLTLPHLPLQFTDFILWQQALTESEIGQRQLVFWQKHLQELPRQILPDDDKVNSRAEHDRWLNYSFDKKLLSALRNCCTENVVTMFVVGLAAIQQLLQAQTGQRDLAIGTPISTRFNADLENIVGLMLNTLVIRINSDIATSGNALLAAIKETVVSAFDNKDVPIEYLQQHILQGQDNKSLYRVRYVYRKLDSQPQNTKPSLNIKALDIDRTQAKFDLLITINETDDALFGDFEYKTSLWQESTIKIMLEQLHYILEWLALRADEPLTTLQAGALQIRKNYEQKKTDKLKQEKSEKLNNLIRRKIN